MKKLFVFIALTLINFTAQADSKVDRSLAASLTQAVKGVNKNAPMALDEETRLDSAATYANVIIYTNTMVNFEASQFDPEEFDKIIKVEVIDTLCTNPALEYFKTAGVIMVYRYLDKNGAYISESQKDMATCPK